MSNPSASPRSLQTALEPIAPRADADDREVTGITADSRDVSPGYIFVAVPGTDTDGHAFVDEAVAKGAAAIVAEHEVGDVPVPVVQVEDARRALADLAAAWYGNPADELAIVGITGSLGKTSVLTTIESILQEAGITTAAIGSEIVGIRVQDRVEIDTQHTTPDPMTLHDGFRQVRDKGAQIACMEVSSHAIDQERVHGLQFAAGIFTNLVALEHQDYHGSFEEYVKVKSRFFDHLEEGAPLVYGIDSPKLRALLADRQLKPISCGFDENADVRISKMHMSADGTSYQLEVRTPLRRHDGSTLDPSTIPLQLRRLGRPHVLNSAFAATIALYLGADPDAIRRALAALPAPARRMQLLPIGDFHVLDDTAGHPDSIDAVFDTVDHLSYRRLHVVTAVRGLRGTEINSELADALARSYQAHPFDSLIVTDSADTVDELNEVTPDEREAYLGTLRQQGVSPEHEERLEDALKTVLERAEEGDLVVLIGAQGMIEGAEMLRALTGANA